MKVQVFLVFVVCFKFKLIQFHLGGRASAKCIERARNENEWEFANVYHDRKAAT